MDRTPYVGMGQRIRTLREAIGMSQAELARRLGVQRSHVNNWEAGRSASPQAHTFIALAKILRADVEWLIYGDPESDGKPASRSK